MILSTHKKPSARTLELKHKADELYQLASNEADKAKSWFPYYFLHASIKTRSKTGKEYVTRVCLGGSLRGDNMNQVVDLISSQTDVVSCYANLD